uniref:DUF1771 domain-containing protein n=1 Tax=Caenorhabditis tropicalis TaxID=1561998 RepID=A0A1I7TZ67_9PELO
MRSELEYATKLAKSEPVKSKQHYLNAAKYYNIFTEAHGMNLNYLLTGARDQIKVLSETASQHSRDIAAEMAEKNRELISENNSIEERRKNQGFFE